MVVFEIDVKGIKRNLYMDNELHYRILNKVKPKVEKKDKDLILKVKQVRTSGQRRVNIPKEEETLKKGDLVKVKKAEIK